MSGHDDFAFEPANGLPAALPAGEALLWQGSPSWRRLAVSAFHVRKVAVYFALVLLWQLQAGGMDALARMGWTVLAGAAAIGILCGLAFAYARSTVYSLTSKRVVIRSGIALPVTVNLPLALIDGADVRRQGPRAGSVALTVARPNRVAFAVLWPNVRPFTFDRPQPMLRALDDVEALVPRLADALRQSGPGLAVGVVPASRKPSPVPGAIAGAAA